jgi:uncharacterized lipoprotein YddW (UPF0748 family)
MTARALLVAVLHAALLATAVGAQTPSAADSLAGIPPIAREFRGVWVATVNNIDWPSSPGLPVCDQQAELIALLDRAVAIHLNAIILQVRPAADALYASKLEPWSEYLTGVQGRAPSPWYDPLAFAVKEAHARGLELHAWFNPYRARQARAKSPASASHISRTMPSLVKSYGPYLWMDPGEPAVRRQTLRVVLDVVRRYDIDGVHIDDYFYPYQEYDSRGRVIDFPDARSWRRYRKNGGTLARADWRRRNVDELVKELYAGVHSVKPWVKFGISPFGIWRPGNPPSITGYDAYERLYGDSRKWLRNGWVDYYTPQLYWPIADIPHSYTTLLEWWVSQNVKGRHMWPGNYTNKVGSARDQGLPAAEILDQIRATRAQPGATGNVHFSMVAFLTDGDSLNEKLAAGLYAEPALVPASPWLEKRVPPPPTLRVRPISPLTLQASIDTLIPRDSTSPVSAIAPVVVLLEPGKKSEPTLWTVRTLGADAVWTTTILPGAAREVALPATTRDVIVTVVGRTGIESPAARLTLQGQPLAPAVPGAR